MKHGQYLFLILVLFLSDIFLFTYQISGGDSVASVSFLDVGQGDSILIESPSGAKMLIDTGRPASSIASLRKEMNFFDKKIDVLLLTHTDIDHNGAAPDILKNYEVEKLFISGDYTKEKLDKEIIEIAKEKGVEVVEAKRGQLIDLGAGAHATILFPDREEKDLESNTASIGMKFTYGETDFILTGDMPSAVEDYLVSLDRDILDSEVLKLGHHGSRTSTSDIFLKIVSPEYVVVSAGKNNSYGHPHKEIREKTGGLKTMETSVEGSIRFETDGKDLWVTK